MNKSWPNLDNSILFEDLWFVETPPPMGHLQLKLSCLTCVYVCMCMCVHACACMCTCVGAPLSTPHPHPPIPRAAGSPKHQNSISLELMEIFQFCLKILYLGTLLDSYRLYLVPLNTPSHLLHPPEPRKPKSETLHKYWANQDN